MSAGQGTGGQPPQPPAPVPVGTPPLWVTIAGAAFGGVSLLAFFGLAAVAGFNPGFVCNAHALLAAAFALGAALSAGFIGGAAAINGNLGLTAQSNALLFSAGGGVAVFFIAFFGFHVVKGDLCETVKKDQRISELVSSNIDLADRVKTLHADMERGLKRIKQQPIVIVANSSQPDLMKRLLIQYINKKGDIQNAERKKNVFTIPWENLLLEDPGIYVVYDKSERPAQGSWSISIDRIDHAIDPLRIQLYLTLPSESSATQ